MAAALPPDMTILALGFAFFLMAGAAAGAHVAESLFDAWLSRAREPVE